MEVYPLDNPLLMGDPKQLEMLATPMNLLPFQSYYNIIMKPERKRK